MSDSTQLKNPKRRWYQFSLPTEDAMIHLKWIVPIALLLVVGTPMYSAGPDDGQEVAIAAIKKLRGSFKIDTKSPDKPVV